VGFADSLIFLGKLWVPVENSKKLLQYAYFGLLGCLFPGESSTQTLFLRVMDTFDDDDDDDHVSLPVYAHNQEHLGL